ncbi:MAG TPA: hypothetical protein VF516_20000 [Kofleriaceae bacterium]
MDTSETLPGDQLVVPSARHVSAKARSFVDHAARALATLGVIRALPARRDHRAARSHRAALLGSRP